MRKKKVTKVNLRTKTDAAYNLLVRDSQTEAHQLEMHKTSYTLKWLCENLEEEMIPNLHKLNKKFPGSKVVNVGGIPILQIKKKTNQGEDEDGDD